MRKLIFVLAVLFALPTFARSRGSGSLGVLNAQKCLLILDEGSATFTITGTWSGTITFQASNNHDFPATVTYTAVKVRQRGVSRLMSTTTVNGSYLAQIAADTQVCVKMTSYVSGTAVVDFNLAPGMHSRTETTNVATLETIACNSGVSPCTLAGSSTAVLNDNPDRHAACFQHVGTTTNIFCKVGGTVSTTDYHFQLGFPGNASGFPTNFCLSGTTVAGGSVNCYGGTGASLAIFPY